MSRRASAIYRASCRVGLARRVANNRERWWAQPTLRLSCLGGVFFAGASLEAQCIEWQQLDALVHPSTTSHHAVAYDSKNDVVVLYGGLKGGGIDRDETWEWSCDSGTWTQAFPPGAIPVARHSHGMAYDPVRQRVVLFGGSPGSDETWEYDGTTWTQRCTGTEEHPPGRAAQGMAYDAAREEVLLFGGYGEGGDLKDTWVLPSSSGCWVEKAPANMPSLREYPAVAYDSDCEVVLLFGGQSPRTNDLWAWDGNNWTKILSDCPGCTNQPSRRFTAALVYDTPNNKLVLFGGNDGPYADDTWEWSWDCSTGSWTQVCTADQPTPRIHTGMAYVDSCSRIMLFGGVGNEAIALDDTWVYPIRCGDGVVEGTEFCDDGFTDACGSCNADCTGLGNNSTCPDGVVCPETEECDDGNSDDTDFCLNDCTINPAIPTVSEWGLVAMTLLVLAAGTVVLMRRRAAA